MMWALGAQTTDTDEGGAYSLMSGNLSCLAHGEGCLSRPATTITATIGVSSPLPACKRCTDV